MSNAKEIIIRPLVTEKTMVMNETDNKVTFEVAKGANKTQVKIAIEEIFNVKVDAVNILNVRPKKKRVGKYVGMTKGYRKAIVKVAKGQEIKIFDLD